METKSGHLTLFWESLNRNDFNGFEIQAKVGWNDWETIVTAPYDASNWTDVFVKSNQTVQYRIRAIDGETQSNPSNVLVLGGQINPDAVTIEFEAEDGEITSPMQIVEDLTASGGLAISVKPGTSNTGSAPSTGIATYLVDITESGTYRILGRNWAPDGDDDSFWVQVNDLGWNRWNALAPHGNFWKWNSFYHEHPGNVIEERLFNLSAGQHTVQVAYREDGAKLDKLMMTSDTGYIPVDPVQAYFQTVTETGEGNFPYISPWFGPFDSPSNIWPIINSAHEGMVYLMGSSVSGGFWYWDYSDEMSWCYTAPSLYPFIYSNTHNYWLYSFAATHWYYNFGDGTFFKVSEE